MSQIIAEISTAWPNILLAWMALAIVAASPGPTLVAIMGIAMSRGRRAALVFTTGCMSGSTTWALMAGLGLSVWLTAYAGTVFYLKVAGGLYLLWMAYKSLKSALRESQSQQHPREVHSGKLYLRGLGLHITNPKAVLGWGAVITLSQSSATSISVLVFTLLGCLAITYTIHYTYAFLFASQASMNFYAKSRRWIEGTLAGVFGYAGYRLLTDEP